MVCCGLNVKLLPVKITYFLTLGGVASLLPFLAVYMKQLGLTPSETAIIYGVMPFLGAFVRTFVGVVADKLQKHKLILMLCCLFTGVLHGCLLLVPKRTTTEWSPVNLTCSPNPTVYSCVADVSNSSQLSCDLGSESIEKVFVDVFVAGDDEVEAINGSCRHYDVTWSENANCTQLHSCSVGNPIRTAKFDDIFWLFFWVCLFGQMFFAPVLSLVDAITYNYIGDEFGKWGIQRLWGTVGYCVLVMISAFSMDTFGDGGGGDTNFTFAFVAFAVLNVLASGTVCSYSIHDEVLSDNFFENIGKVIKNIEVLFLLLQVFHYGAFIGLIETFLYWHLGTLGAPHLLNGLCNATYVIPEILVLIFAGQIIGKIGHLHCLHVATLAFALRFLGLSFLKNPWFVLLVEPLHAACFGLMYAAASSYANILTPPGLSGTVQGLVGAVYFGAGKGIGSIVGGLIFEKYHAVVTFRIYSTAAFIFLAFSFVINLFVIKPRKEKREKEQRRAAEKTIDAKEEVKMLPTEQEKNDMS